MNFKKVLVSAVLMMILAVCAVAVPTVSDISDSVLDAGFEPAADLFSENEAVINIGAKASATNVRFVEIDGVQKKITENNDTYTVSLGDSNMLVEITEKTSEDAQSVVKTQYFYIDVVNKTAEKLSAMDTHMQSYEEKSIRTVGEMGIRFKAHVSTDAKYEKTQFVVDEYGYLISTEELLDGEALTLESGRYVKGVGFNREQGINIVYDATNDAFDVFTLVLKNIPVEHYKANVVCKTYTKLRVCGESFVVYGEEMSGSAYDVAKKAFINDFTNTDIAQMIFDYASYEGVDDSLFGGSVISSTISEGLCTVTGSFANEGSIETSYNVYLATFNEYGTMISVNKSPSFTLKDGMNNFEVTFSVSAAEKQAKAYVFTANLEFAGCENKGNWRITEKSFYDSLASVSFSADNGYFNPDSDVSAIEAITLLSNIHARYNNKNVADGAYKFEHTFQMDDADILIDLSERNSVNLDGINFNWAEGGIDEENGYLYGTSTVKKVKADGTKSYDPGVVINGLKLDARNYNKITLRVKYEQIEGSVTNIATESLQIFFKTSTDTVLDEKKKLSYNFRNEPDVKDWFEIEFDVSANEYWKDVISGIRIDPLFGYAKFYIDYVTFSKSESTLNDSWYDTYLDYAIENNIISLGQYNIDELTCAVTNGDFAMMFANSLPESAFASINSVKAIPDLDKNGKNTDIFLQLYKAGITLGFDENGNFLPKGTLKRSDAASMANRLLVPANRLRGTINASWTGSAYVNDLEFDSATDVDGITFRKLKSGTNAAVTDGTLVFDGESDSGLVITKFNIDADRFIKLKVRLKADFDTEPTTNDQKRIEVYFKPDDYVDPITNYFKHVVLDESSLDPFGWYVFEIDMSTHHLWNGDVNYFRFDPMNAPGKYTIDYIRFIESPYADLPTQKDLEEAGYTSIDIMPGGFKNGFYVSDAANSYGTQQMIDEGRIVTFPESTGDPIWTLGPWYHGAGTEDFPQVDLWLSRKEDTDDYTIADTYGINTVTYNPELDSITQRLNATKIYNGKPHIASEYSWWPHQLFNVNENFTSGVDKEVCSADADRMFVEMDIKMTDFKDTTNTEGMNVCSYLAYFYLRNKQFPTHKIWFGFALFKTNTTSNNLSAPTTIQPSWGPDSAAHQFMYGIPQAAVYNGIENSFNPSKGVVATGDDWKHIVVDITPHIDRAVEWANRDNIFGFPVEKKDMYFEGLNIGYEVHGNYDATFEIKDIKMLSYSKPE